MSFSLCSFLVIFSTKVYWEFLISIVVLDSCNVHIVPFKKSPIKRYSIMYFGRPDHALLVFLCPKTIWNVNLIVYEIDFTGKTHIRKSS